MMLTICLAMITEQGGDGTQHDQRAWSRCVWVWGRRHHGSSAFSLTLDARILTIAQQCARGERNFGIAAQFHAAFTAGESVLQTPPFRAARRDGEVEPATIVQIERLALGIVLRNWASVRR